MWNIKIPAQSSLEVLATAFPLQENLCKLGNDRALVSQLYSDYDSSKGVPSDKLLGQNLSLQSRQLIHDAYSLTYKDKALNQVRKDLYKLTFKCVYCGFGELYELDHYLPRSIYKAYSIHVRNLIPCCHTCNHTKKTANNFTPDQQYLHAYYHVLPDTVILDAKLNTFDGGFSIDFKIIGYEKLEHDNVKRAKYQFTELLLNDRYEQEAISMICNLMTGMVSAYAEGAQSLRNHLAAGYLDSLKNHRFGKNHWQTALWRSLLLSKKLHDVGPRAALNL